MSEVSAFSKLAARAVDRPGGEKNASESQVRKSETRPPVGKVFNQVRTPPETSEDDEGERRVKPLEGAVQNNQATKTTLNSVSSGAADEVVSENRAARDPRLEDVDSAARFAESLAGQISEQPGLALAAQPIGDENLRRVGLTE
jgi:hypothetical protein